MNTIGYLVKRTLNVQIVHFRKIVLMQFLCEHRSSVVVMNAEEGKVDWWVEAEGDLFV